ncbi:hypothetical protein [Pseudomonas tohonis]|uniref:hypothetical protein n=1 Tax=Pseudomonas tohonis TaxID=2725477 RepID=UPI001F417F89|nr:hypothetical protein [Pseudomonas tohonis]GJN49441.1 hypothetical protein TUM20249_54270 [Pseudomonas tohonis]
MSDMELFAQLNYGKVHVRLKGSTLPPFEFGPLRAVGFTPELNELSVADPRTRSNSELTGVSRPAGGTLQGELLALPPETLATLLAGTRNEVAAGTVTDEAVVVMVGRTTMTKRLPLKVTKLTSEDGAEEYDAGVDFVKTPGGFRVLAGGALATAIAAETADTDGNKSLTCKVSYSTPKASLVQAFMKSRRYYEVFIETMNEAGDDMGRRVTFRRARIGLSGDLPLINRDDIAAIGVTFTLSEDPDYAFDGSGFFEWEEELPA